MEPLAEAIANAARAAIVELFSNHPSETFYYCSLITTGEGHPPLLSAWSEESLEAVVEAEGDVEGLIDELRWSYADSPYYCFGETYFKEVERLYLARSGGKESATTDRGELDYRLNAMEKAMAALDAEGLFGKDDERIKIFINAEVMPPDSSNVERARRLNPTEAMSKWLREASEI